MIYSTNLVIGLSLRLCCESLPETDAFDNSTAFSRYRTKIDHFPNVYSGALGGGAEITTACDYRLCSSHEKMRIGFVHSKMGIVPAWGGTHRLVQIVGKTKALDLLLTGSLLDKEKALHIGLVNGIANNVDESYYWLLDRVKQDVSVVRAAKAAIANAAQIPAHVIENESRLFAPLWGGRANKEALAKHIKHR